MKSTHVNLLVHKSHEWLIHCIMFMEVNIPVPWLVLAYMDIYIYGILCTEGVVCGRMQFLPLVQTKVSASGFC